MSEARPITSADIKALMPSDVSMIKPKHSLDLNDYTEEGRYLFDGVDIINKPSTATARHGFLDVKRFLADIPNGNRYIVQQFSQNTGKIYQRSMWAKAWGAWKEITVTTVSSVTS